MEIHEKARKYLYENIGNMTTAGTPRYDMMENIWKVPVLCKTERGIIIAGEFHVNEGGDFINIPTKQEMQRTVKIEDSKLPYLYYGAKHALEEHKINSVRI